MAEERAGKVREYEAAGISVSFDSASCRELCERLA